YQSRYLTKEQLNGQPMAITTSRGCYGDCSFCSISSFYKLNGEIKQTYRSADSVANEIRLLVKHYNIDSLKIVDDNFFRDNSDAFLESLANQIEDLNISIRLSARPNDITENRARLLKKMGVTIVGIGAESADEQSLKFFNKGIGIEASDNAIEILNKYGITCLVNYIMFNPIIDLNGLKKNLDFVDKYQATSVFHRINSHLWIRSTDPLVNKLVDYKLCDRVGFPYVECRYLNENVYQIMELFDKWCNHNMKEYYENVDILMAKGIPGNETYDAIYRKILQEDIFILRNLIQFANRNELKKKGDKYISMCIAASDILELCNE
ncbi:MAG: radical SAM protein, partial [Odoribacter sp.]|nr:radical SAM protein [Odoribacter sp.]